TTPIRETIAFAVQTYPQEQFVSLNLMANKHSTMVASAAAGKGFFGGDVNGVAPEAQILALDQGKFTVAGVIESLILAAQHPQFDVITVQASFSMPLNDGHSTAAIICDRLVKRYRKPIFASAGNSGPGLNNITEYANGSKVISVGGYVNRDTWRTV